MKIRWMVIGLLFFTCALFSTQGCSKKKVYTLDEPGAKTASLTFPEFIQIRGIDEESVESFFSRMLYEGRNEVVLPAGSHEVEFRYNDIWEIDENDHEKVTSYYILLQFEAQPGGKYKFKVDPPEDRQSAQSLAAHFNPPIIDVRTGKVVSRFVAQE
jgi:uncharacterized protein YccT (UPF0319 family)